MAFDQLIDRLVEGPRLISQGGLWLALRLSDAGIRRLFASVTLVMAAIMFRRFLAG